MFNALYYAHNYAYSKNMAAIRMNITIPVKVMARFKKQVKARERSSVIAQALEEYLNKTEREKIMADIVDGYRSRALEISDTATDEWSSVDGDGIEDEITDDKD